MCRRSAAGPCMWAAPSPRRHAGRTRLNHEDKDHGKARKISRSTRSRCASGRKAGTRQRFIVGRISRIPGDRRDDADAGSRRSASSRDWERGCIVSAFEDKTSVVSLTKKVNERGRPQVGCSYLRKQVSRTRCNRDSLSGVCTFNG